MLKRAVAEVIGGQNTVGIQSFNPTRSSVQVHTVGFLIVMLPEPAQHAGGIFPAGGGNALPTAHDDRLQLLAAHHRAQTSPSVEVA